MPPSTPAAAVTDYDELLKKKIRAGLSPADAKEVVERQKAHDANLAKAAAPVEPAPVEPAADDAPPTGGKGKKGAPAAAT
jgi:hypothetical protein